jgi:hypothetical protein
MRWYTRTALAGLTLAGLMYGQRRFRSFDDDEDNPTAIPPDATEKTEFLFSRLRYPPFRGGYGYRRSSWATDYPKADRQFLQGLRRLTRLHTRSMENVVDLDSDEIFNYPWIYAVEVGHWGLSDPQAKKLREYLDRGGFLMVDDFHGSYEWDVFYDSLRRVYPDIPVADIESKDQLHHILYDIDTSVQVPGIHTYFGGSTYERDGIHPRWRAIYDAQGRATVAICHNMDLGDAWEWADHPQYPEQYAAVAYRVAVNYIIYSMTH